MDPVLVELLKKFSKELDDVLGGIEIYDGLQADFSKAAQSQIQATFDLRPLYKSKSSFEHRSSSSTTTNAATSTTATADSQSQSRSIAAVEVEMDDFDVARFSSDKMVNSTKIAEIVVGQSINKSKTDIAAPSDVAVAVAAVEPSMLPTVPQEIEPTQEKVMPKRRRSETRQTTSTARKNAKKPKTNAPKTSTNPVMPETAAIDENKTEASMPCLNCDKVLSNREDFFDHLIGCGPKTVVCQNCDREFDKTDFIKHLIKEYESSEKEILCRAYEAVKKMP